MERQACGHILISSSDLLAWISRHVHHGQVDR